MKITAKLNTIPIVIIFMTITFAIIIWLSFQEMHKKEIQGKNTTSIIVDIFKLDVLMHEYLLHPEERPRVQWKIQNNTLSRLMDGISFKDPQDENALIRLQNNQAHMAKQFNRMVSLHEDSEFKKDWNFFSQVKEHLQSRMELDSQNMIRHSVQLHQRSQEALINTQKKMAWILITVMLFFGILISLITALVSRSILKPVSKLSYAADVVGTGNLDFQIASKRNDELGEFSRTFDRMVEQLKATLISRDALEKKVAERSAELSTTNTQLKAEIEKKNRREEELKRAEEKLQKSFSEIKQLKDRLQKENIYLREKIEVKYHHGNIIGKSEGIKQVLGLAEKVAKQDTSILILGETGTGKELLAHSIHNMSPRKKRTMISVNCAALPSSLIESELFGREKGAFTGALSRQAGRFEAADGSTIFLDEIGELPLHMQVKLLRVLQEGNFERLGNTKTINADVRIIAATNQDLGNAVKTGKFRKDLYYRLNVFPITIPPLRDRRDDIPLLVWYLVREFEKSMGKKIESITEKTMDLLKGYMWPGNIRELKNIIERTMILNTGSVFRIHRIESEETAEQVVILDDAMRHHILKVLGNTGWRISGKNGAAEILGLKRTTLLTKMKKLNIQRDK